MSTKKKVPAEEEKDPELDNIEDRERGSENDDEETGLGIYKIRRVLRSWRHRVLQTAVLEPALGRHLREYGLSREEIDHQFISEMGNLQTMWREQIANLSAAGYKRLSRTETIRAAHLCPPFGFSSSKTFCMCSITPICPFCYARRYVRKSFHFLEDLIYGPPPKSVPGKRGPAPRDVDERRFVSDRLYLIASRTTARVPIVDTYGTRFNNVRYTVEGMRDMFLNAKGREIAIQRPLVGIGSLRVIPEEAHIRYHVGAIMVVESERKPTKRELSRLDARIVPHELRAWPVTKANLAEAVSAVIPYPREYLTADAEDIMAMLKAMQRVQLFNIYGGRKLKPGFGVVYTGKHHAEQSLDP